uniref:SFRICE_007912 n=1 Tax=Spodoptera frugiperda TaxID=7108 RepID=A0A2H1W1L1_SPOFR
MTDKENETGATPAGGSKVVMVEQSTVSSHKPYRPTDLQDDASGELHHKRSRAPAVPSVAEEFKDSPESAEIKEQLETTKEGERGMSVDKIKNIDKKVSSSISKKRPSTPEAIPLTPIEVEVKKTEIIATPALHPMQPIPAGLGSKASEISELPDKKETEGKDEEDSITGEIAELRTPDPTQKSAEWSDEEEAGGLPRSDSRASRVSRAVRQLFCCGVPYDAPSEENVSTMRGDFPSGI